MFCNTYRTVVKGGAGAGPSHRLRLRPKSAGSATLLFSNLRGIRWKGFNLVYTVPVLWGLQEQSTVTEGSLFTFASFLITVKFCYCLLVIPAVMLMLSCQAWLKFIMLSLGICYFFCLKPNPHLNKFLSLCRREGCWYIYHQCLGSDINWFGSGSSSVAEPPLLWAAPAPAPEAQGLGADSCSDPIGSAWAPAPDKKGGSGSDSGSWR